MRPQLEYMGPGPVPFSCAICGALRPEDQPIAAVWIKDTTVFDGFAPGVYRIKPGRHTIYFLVPEPESNATDEKIEAMVPVCVGCKEEGVRRIGQVLELTARDPRVGAELN